MMKRLLPLLLLLAGSSALAESGAYRVELIIFRNLAVTADGTGVDDLRSFSRFPALEEASLPDGLLVLDEKSENMDAIWRRLRSSKGYRPLVFAAWEQNRTDYYPPMRVHDEMVLDEQLHPPTNIMIADLVADDPLGAYLSMLYHIDGTVQLRRSRFLHLHLDLEYREKTPKAGAQAAFTAINDPVSPDSNLMIGGTEEKADYNIYTLKQNRQIQTGRMQYFDTPHFGALVFVTAIDQE